MAFDADAKAQFQAIQQNLKACAQTPDAERAHLAGVISTSVAGVTEADVTLDHVNLIQTAVRASAERNDLYFKGAPTAASGLSTFSTRREDKLQKGLAFALKAEDPSLLVTDAMLIANDIVLRLSAAVTSGLARIDYGQLPLHVHGTPMWIAVLEASEASAIREDVAYPPARLGLAPESDRPVRYVLMAIHTSESFRPRFADSGAYPYWEPGGKTRPLEQCPAGLNGLAEVVVNNVRVGSIRDYVVIYERAA